MSTASTQSPFRCTAAALAAVLAALTVCAAATASRAPTKSERAAISKALHKSSATGAVHCFSVRQVVVSTVAPWARGRIFPCGGDGDHALAVLQRSHGHWRVRDLGTSGVGCTVAPKKVRLDLKLDCH